MRFGKTLTAAVLAMSVASTPALAQATNAASALSVSSARAGAALEDESNLGGGFIIPLIAVAAIILGILAVTNDGKDAPTSP